MPWQPVAWRCSLQPWWALRCGSFDPDTRRAIELVRAVVAGGLPLNPAQVNAIARGLGLEVSARAPVEQAIARIRQALERVLPRWLHAQPRIAGRAVTLGFPETIARSRTP